MENSAERLVLGKLMYKQHWINKILWPSDAMGFRFRVSMDQD